jgi:hypothetical protein
MYVSKEVLDITNMLLLIFSLWLPSFVCLKKSFLVSKVMKMAFSVILYKICCFTFHMRSIIPLGFVLHSDKMEAKLSFFQIPIQLTQHFSLKEHLLPSEQQCARGQYM